MITSLAPGATASADSSAPTAPAATASGAAFIPPEDHPVSRDRIRHLLYGTPTAINRTIWQLHKLGYAEPNDWSRPIATERPGEVMVTLMKRLGAD